MKEILLEHKQRYPDMEVRDVVKLLYQSEFGGGHLIADEAESLQRIKDEYKTLVRRDGNQHQSEAYPLAEAIGGGLYRVSLRLIDAGLSPETLNKMFIETAKLTNGCVSHLEIMLSEWLQLLCDGGYAEEYRKTMTYLDEYRRNGYPAVSHSQRYRSSYYPAYRIVASKYVDCLKICCDIDHMITADSEAVLSSADERKKPYLVAIDGCCASGKTTLASSLAELYEVNVFHMDDFFLQPWQRTPRRYLEPGGNVDYERFKHTVLDPLLSGESFTYQRFNCQRQQLGNETKVIPRHLNIIEGAYSQHDYFGDVYQLGYWLFVDADEQKRRILSRNGAEMLKRFEEEWIPLENAYFAAQGVGLSEDNV